MVANVAKIRQLIATVRELAPHMTDEEISEIGQVLLKVTNRLLNNESEEI
ncbi:TPA: hypothetical protein ACXDAZ_002253 [Clostridium botulinum]|nr:hypothetical protein [Clostridium botulinum]APC80217.1 hypothetical protein NPD2_1051 [Clostridium botulinum]MCS4449146.1 hypothetical protein [Clostridium botulinum]MCS4459079.1 hypothetical protein [Clostridium botulinum]MCS4462466.1 hypothetical protein [Clostridium botulinum]MCS4512210.1 hypothetical protein [Clostridium botulinum]